MVGLPDLIGRLIDVEQPPFNHQGQGMRCTLWMVHTYPDGKVEVEGTEGYSWLMDDETRITLIQPEYDNTEMQWRAGIEQEIRERRGR